MSPGYSRPVPPHCGAAADHERHLPRGPPAAPSPTSPSEKRRWQPPAPANRPLRVPGPTRAAAVAAPRPPRAASPAAARRQRQQPPPRPGPAPPPLPPPHGLPAHLRAGGRCPPRGRGGGGGGGAGQLRSASPALPAAAGKGVGRGTGGRTGGRPLDRRAGEGGGRCACPVHGAAKGILGVVVCGWVGGHVSSGWASFLLGWLVETLQPLPTAPAPTSARRFPPSQLSPQSLPPHPVNCLNPSASPRSGEFLTPPPCSSSFPQISFNLHFSLLLSSHRLPTLTFPCPSGSLPDPRLPAARELPRLLPTLPGLSISSTWNMHAKGEGNHPYWEGNHPCYECTASNPLGTPDRQQAPAALLEEGSSHQRKCNSSGRSRSRDGGRARSDFTRGTPRLLQLE